jgi:hypothetical protein
MRRFDLRQAVSIAAGLCLALFVLAHGVASADDAKCVNTVNKNAAKVAKAQSKDNAKCIKDGGGGKLTGTIEDCIVSDPKGKVGKASRKLKEKVESACADSVLPIVPPIEVDDPDGLSEIMIDKELAVIHAIFGTDLDAAGLIVKKVDDKLGWKYQSAIAKAAGKCQNAKLASFNSCKKVQLKAGVHNAGQLQYACLGTGTDPATRGIPDGKGKIGKKCGNGLGGTVGMKCAALDTDALFPPCAGHPVSLVQCLDEKIECEVCKALNELDGLDRNCDEFDNGAADGSCGEAEPTEPDRDGDDWNNDIESCLGSDPTDPNSNPETAAIPETCNDHLDNDGDGATDQDDSGCNLPGPTFGTFPPAGLDVFESSLELQGYELEIPGFGICPVNFDSLGPTCVQRGDPGTDPNSRDVIDIEIVAMQLRGTAVILADPNCDLAPGPYEVNIYENPDQASGGKVTESSPPTPGIDFPAESFFDVFFQIEVEVPSLGEITIPGGPPGGPAGAPVQVDNTGINALPPYHTPGNPCVNPLCYAVPGLPHLHCPEPPLDHYKVYEVDDVFANIPVTLRDQFTDDPNVVLEAIDAFATPVQKTVGERVYEIADPFTHLVWYRFTGSAPPRSVDIHNQFGHQTLVVTNPTHLLVAAVKNDECPDVRERFHFKCYDATGPDPNQIVKLDDQFHHDPNSEIVDVGKVEKFCTPADKNDEGIENERDHLTCYRIDPQIPLNISIGSLDQFGPGSLTVRQNEYLCVPTHKHDWVELPPCELGPWPTCNGICPEPLVCDNREGPLCRCVDPEPCESSSAPTCGGRCIPLLICVDLGGHCACL